MPSDDESSVVEISSPEVQFISQDDDEETLWEVVEITGETPKHFKVKWAGIDPKTGKPWQQSWVPKHDCTNDIVIEWKMKQAKKKKEQERKKSSKRESTASRKNASAISRTSRGSVDSSSTAKVGSSASAATAKNTKPGTSASGTSIGKRKHDSRKSVSAEMSADVNALRDEEPSHPRKKRKMQVEMAESDPMSSALIPSSPEDRRKSSGKIATHEGDDDEVMEVIRVSSKSKGKGKATSLFDDEEETASTTRKSKAATTPKPSKEKQSNEGRMKEEREKEKVAEERREKEKVAGERHSKEKEKRAKEKEQEERRSKEQEKRAKEKEAEERWVKEKAEKERRAKEKAEKERRAGEKEAEEKRGVEKEADKKRVMRAKEAEGGQWKEKEAKGKQPRDRLPNGEQATISGSIPAMESLPIVNGAGPVNSGNDTSSKREVATVNVASSRASSAAQTNGSSHGSTSNKQNVRSHIASNAEEEFYWDNPSLQDNHHDDVIPTSTKPPPERDTAFPPTDQDRGESPVAEIPEKVPSSPPNVGFIHPILSPLALSRLAEFDAAILDVQSFMVDPDDEAARDMEDMYIEFPVVGHEPAGVQPRLHPDAQHEDQYESDEEQQEDVRPGLHADVEHKRQHELDKEPQMVKTRGKLPLFLPGSPEDSELDLVYPTLKPEPEPEPEPEALLGPAKKSKSASTDYSYDHEIVPETDSSRNNTESQETQAEAPASVKTPSRSTIKSRMKPRTPSGGSKASIPEDDHVSRFPLSPVDDGSKENDSSPKPRDSSKLLGPIPRMSPSMFTALLPPSSMAPNSTIETADDAPMSSLEAIEQFESPEKLDQDWPRLVRSRRATSEKSDGSVEQRGQELAEAAKERARKERGEGRPNRISLFDIMKNTSESGGKGKGKGKEKEKLLFLDRREYVIYSTPHDSGGTALDTSVVQEIEDAYVNLNSGAVAEEDQTIATEPSGEDWDDHHAEPMNLRQEEEESTQEIMQEMTKARNMDEVDIDTGWEPPASQGRVQQSGASGYEPGDEGARMDEPMDDTQPPLELPSSPARPSKSPAPKTPVPSKSPTPQQEPRVEQPPTNIEPVGAASRSRSRSKSRAHSEGPSKAAKQNSNSSIHHTAPTHLISPEATVSFNLEHFPEGAPKNLNSVMTLLEVKSEEITKLDYQLSFEMDKNDGLTKEVEMLKEALKHTQDGPSSRELALEQELAGARQAFEAEKVKWEVERDALTTSLASASAVKAQAVKDRDFFQDNYRQASAFVGSVRDENAELEKRADIAEQQAKSGVAMVKATFEQRVKALEEDARGWKRMAMFVIEKDQRTNDDIRRRAAEEPELRAECQRLEGVLEGAGRQILMLERQLTKTEADGRRLESQVDAWKQEVTRLNVELNEVKAKLDTSSKGREINGAPNDMVYRCQWRLEDTDESCGALFLNVEELQNHLFSGGHIHD